MTYSRRSPPQGYYIYAYIRSKDSNVAPKGTPYYIGKGHGNRAWTKHRVQVPDNPDYIVILECNLTEIGAFALERRLIRWYGRILDSDGILENVAKGGPSGRSHKGKPGKKGIKNKHPYPLQGKTYEEIFGPEYAAIKKAKLKDYWKSEQGKENHRKAGLKIGKILKEKGWAPEIVAKRVETRRQRGTFNTDMSACHTPEAIAKRTQTRSEKGVNHNTTVCNMPEFRHKRQRTKLLALINQLEETYNRKFSRELLRKARKDRVSYLQDKTLYRYLTVDELNSYGYTSGL